MVLVAVFRKEGSGLRYHEIRIEKFFKSKIKKYLYRRGASQGPDYTPTAKITEVKKFFKNKVKSWFKKYNNYNDPVLNNLKVAIEKSEQKILKDLSQKLEEVKLSLKRNKGCLFTLAIEVKGQLRYLGDFDIFKDLLVGSVKQDYK